LNKEIVGDKIMLLEVFMHGPALGPQFRGEPNEECTAAIAVLQERWPVAFPENSALIRPLAEKNLVETIAENTGWSKRYTRGVLSVWKRRTAYSRSVLRYQRRYDLTGAETDESISEQARSRAAEVARADADGEGETTR
jgi:sRNA-binding protein